jgi:hypothetical protein
MSTPSIVGEWVHAHERDRGDAHVFVDGAQALPPSRGRRRLSFRPDGTYVDRQPGADDRCAKAGGTYEFDGKTLTLRRGAGAPPLVYQASAGQDHSLQLRKL